MESSPATRSDAHELQGTACAIMEEVEGIWTDKIYLST